MAEYIFTGTLLLSGVTFYVTADDLADAKAKAIVHQYDDYDVSAAEGVDATIDLSSGELNE